MKLVILAVSDKHKEDVSGGYCVAGIQYDFPHKWVRLVGKHDSFKLTNSEAVYKNGERRGTLCQPLDIVEVEASLVDLGFLNRGILKGYPTNLLYVQPENYYIHRELHFLRKMSIEELLNIVPLEMSDEVLGSDRHFLTLEEAVKLKKSLTIVKVDNLELYPQRSFYNGRYKEHYKARFTYKGKTYENISVTDPEYAAGLTDYSELTFGDTYLVMSIGEEFRNCHYKIIARIFEVVYTIENNNLKYFHAYRDCKYLARYNTVIRDLYGNLVRKNLIPCQACESRNNLIEEEIFYV